MANQYAIGDPNRENALLVHSGTANTAETIRMTGQTSGAVNMYPYSGNIDADPRIDDAIRRIQNEYGDTVSVATKAKALFKFGRTENAGTTRSTVWFTGQDQANETYPANSTNPIDHISSSSTADTQVVVIEGHTDSGGTKTFVTQSGTLSGQTPVALGTPLNRATRLYNDGSVNFAGEVYCYEGTAVTTGKPTDTTKIHITVDGPGGHNQSEKASTSLSSQDYWIITTFRGSMLKKTAGFVDVALELRQSGKVFREIEDVTSQGLAGVIKFDPYIIIPPNSDVRLVAVADANNTEVSGSMFGYLAVITS